MKGLALRSLSGETEPYSLLLLVSSTTTGTGREMLRRYSGEHRLCERFWLRGETREEKA